MKITNIKATNFLSIEELDLKLDGLGLTLIFGENKDDSSASGAGKTSVLDAISFALFGSSPRGIKADAFIQRGKKTCSVTLDLSLDDGTPLSITRTRKPEDLFYTKDGVEHRGTTIKETQKDIEELLKIDLNTFLNSIYFSQETNKFFISSTDSEKVEILTKVLDLSTYDKLYEMAKTSIKEEEEKLNDLRAEAGKFNAAVETLNQTIESTQAKEEEFKQEIINKSNRLLRSVPVINAKIEELKGIILEYKNKVYDVKAIPQPVAPDWDKLNFEVSSEEDTIKRLKSEDSAPEPVKPTEIDEKAKLITSKEEELKQLEEKERKFNTEVDLAVSRFSDKINDNLAKIAKIESTGEGVCPHCFNVVSKEHLQKVIDEVKQETEKLQSAKETILAKAKAKILPLKEQKILLEEEIRLSEEELTKMQGMYDLSVIEYRKAKDNFSSKLLHHTELLSRKQSQLQDAKLDFQRQQAEYERKVNNLEQLRQKDLMYVKTVVDQIKSLVEERENAAKEAEEVRNEKNPFTEMLSDLNDKLLVQQRSQQEILAKIDATMVDIEDLNTLKKDYKNVKMYVFESTIEEMNVRISKYLEPLFNEDINIRFKYKTSGTSCKFDTEIIKNGSVSPFNALSSGEKVRCEIATNFALSDIVSMRKSSSLNLLILDEVANGMCAIGKERLVHLLERLKSEKDSILVIDHFPTMESIIDNKIIVTKQNNISTVGVV